MRQVLIVDHDVEYTQSCAAMLRHDGYAVTQALSLSSARAAISAEVPDAILLEWKLRDGTALDALHWLQSRNLLRPSALVTPFWNDGEFHDALSKARTFGVSACLRRGLDILEPGAVVRLILDPLVRAHSDILRGSLSARELLTTILLRKLVPRLRRRFGGQCSEMASDAVTDAIIQHLRDPAAFDPVRHGAIEGFIWMHARRNLSNALRSTRRHAVRTAEYARLHAVHVGRRYVTGIADHHRVILQSLDWEQDGRVRAALREWLAGEHGSSPWLTIPSLTHLAPMETRREIKRQKDRFIARVKRLAQAESQLERALSDEVEKGTCCGGHVAKSDLERPVRHR
jgi:CheY-like chemotaxis protein